MIRTLIFAVALAFGFHTLETGNAAAAPLSCDAALSMLHSTTHPLPQLPTLMPGRNKALSLDMMMRLRDGIFIGPYQVDGVPVLEIKLRNGTKAYILDPATNRDVEIDPKCLTKPELIYRGTLWKLSQGYRMSRH